jgi:hypothetical protein
MQNLKDGILRLCVFLKNMENVFSASFKPYFVSEGTESNIQTVMQMVFL